MTFSASSTAAPLSPLTPLLPPQLHSISPGPYLSLPPAVFHFAGPPSPCAKSPKSAFPSPPLHPSFILSIYSGVSYRFTPDTDWPQLTPDI
jgi:hypothetical protein